jgi:hypothetical protein
LKRIFNGVGAAIVALSATISFSACKENTIIPTSAVPAVDNIHVFGTDTLSLLTKSVRNEDSFATSVYASGYNVVMGGGAINSDPFFGKTYARFYFQVRYPQVNYIFDQTKYQADSMVLVVPYSGFSWGDTSLAAGTQTFTAYRVTGEFSRDSIYYSNSPDRTIDPSPLGSVTMNLSDLVRSKYDSTLVLGVRRSPHIRIPMPSSLMTEIITASGGDSYKDVLSFMTFLKGFYINCDQNAGNCIPYFRLNGTDNYSTACIQLYYHTRNSGGGVTDTLMTVYPFEGGVTGFYNKISHDYSGTPAASYLSSTAKSDDITLVQNQPGAATEIVIPHVKSMPRAVINKAELVLSQVGSPWDAVFWAPDRIYIYGVDKDGHQYTIKDRYPVTDQALAFINGNARTTTVGGMVIRQYVLNIPRELERAIAEQRDELRLRINGASSYPGAFRTVVAGSNYSMPQYRAKLNIIYTKL